MYIEQERLLGCQIMKLKMEKDIVGIPNVVDVTSRHLCIGRRSPFTEILPRLNALMADMERSGTLDEIRDAVFGRYR